MRLRWPRRGVSTWPGLRRRRAGQGLVEYGIIVAAVAFVALVGLNAITAAEQSAVMLGGPDSLAAATPVVGFFNHSTETTINCGGITNYIADGTTTMNCTVLVRDSSPAVSSRTPPLGLVLVVIDTIFSPSDTCSLSPASAEMSGCSFNHLITPVEGARLNPHALIASYGFQASNHAASATTMAFNISPKLDFQIGCTNPWNSGWSAPLPGQTARAELGQPLICRVTVFNVLAGVPYDGAQVQLTAPNVGGWPYFSCYTNNTYLGPGSVTDTQCAPALGYQPVSPAERVRNCTTNAAGVCVNGLGQSDFLYRRTRNDGPIPLALPLGDQIIATALGQTGVKNVTIEANLSPHPTGTVIKCSPPPGVTVVPAGPAFVRVTPPVTVQSDVNLTASAPFPMSCGAAVLDLAPNTTFDSTGCIPPPGVPMACNIDAVPTHAPLGQVTFSVRDTGTGTPIPGLPPLTCQLGGGAGQPPATHVPAQPAGQVRYASWCPTPVTLPIPPNSHWTVVASYDGQPSNPTPPHSPSPPSSGGGNGFAALDMHIDVP